MPGILGDVSWFESLNLSMGECNNVKKKIRKKQKKRSREKEESERKWGHPCHIWMLP